MQGSIIRHSIKASGAPLIEEVHINAQIDDKHLHGNASEYILLPMWLKPHMLYPKDSVVRKGFLGRGEYGYVHKGVFRHGQAV